MPKLRGNREWSNAEEVIILPRAKTERLHGLERIGTSRQTNRRCLDTLVSPETKSAAEAQSLLAFRGKSRACSHRISADALRLFARSARLYVRFQACSKWRLVTGSVRFARPHGKVNNPCAGRSLVRSSCRSTTAPNNIRLWFAVRICGCEQAFTRNFFR